MQKLFLLTLSMIVLLCEGRATPLTVNCTLFPVTFTNGAGTASVTCPGFSVGGATSLNSVTLSETSDYQFGSPSTNIVQVSFTPAVFGGVTWTPPTSVATSTGTVSSGAIGTATQSAATGVNLANFASAFAVQLTSAVTQGTVTTSSGSVQVTYNYSTTIPETSTISMVSLGILAFGLVARKLTS